MRKLICLATMSAALLVACEEKSEPKTDIPKITTEPPTREEVEKKVEANQDGPDCETFVKEVREACVNRFENGLDVDCHGYITKANTAVKQKEGKLFNDPSGKRDTRGAGDRMCAMYGNDLRKDVAAGKKIESGPKCAELGKKLDERCFSFIGTTDYAAICSGPLIALKRVTKDADTFCESQLVVFR